MRRTSTLLLVLAGCGVAAVPAPAATLSVTSFADGDPFVCSTSSCSLRAAVTLANGTAGPDEIVLPAGTFRLTRFGVDDANTSGDLDVADDLTIRGAGAGATTLMGAMDERVLDVEGQDDDLTLRDLTITGGRATTPAAGNDLGGGLRARTTGTVTLERVVVRNNLARGEAALGYGGGIHNAFADLVIRDSAIVGNVASSSGAGGGIYLAGTTSSATLVNTTIADNHATSSGGGGLFVDGAASVTLTHVTLTGNEAAGSGGIDGALDGVRIRSSVIAQNRGTVAAPNCTAGGAESLGGNVGDPGCGFGLPSDVAVADPLLGALGGDLPTREPLAGSPAIDVAAAATCPTADQRGLARPQGAGCDAGAAERPVPPPAPTPPAPVVQQVPGPTVTVTVPAKPPTFVLPSRRSLRRGKATLALTCPAGGQTCAGTVRLRARSGRRTVTIATASFTIAAGRKQTLSLSLTRTGRRLSARPARWRRRSSSSSGARSRRPARSP